MGNNCYSFVLPHEKEHILSLTGIFNQQSSHFILILSYGSCLACELVSR